MQNRHGIAYILVLIPAVVSIYFCFNPESLIPPGYQMAIDGYVISKTLMSIFAMYTLSKLGYFLLNKKD